MVEDSADGNHVDNGRGKYTRGFQAIKTDGGINAEENGHLDMEAVKAARSTTVIGDSLDINAIEEDDKTGSRAEEDGPLYIEEAAISSTVIGDSSGVNAMEKQDDPGSGDEEDGHSIGAAEDLDLEAIRAARSTTKIGDSLDINAIEGDAMSMECMSDDNEEH
jgi:hypothetical protein